MNKFAELMEGLGKRASDEKIMKMLEELEELEILRGLPYDGAKKPRVRLPYSSDPRSFEERWK